jgi:hypothetical protein
MGETLDAVPEPCVFTWSGTPTLVESPGMQENPFPEADHGDDVSLLRRLSRIRATESAWLDRKM